MEGKIKIRTMKSDLANANDDENKKLKGIKQDQNKPSIATAKISGFGVASDTTPDKFKDEEIGELKDLIERISENGGEKIAEKKHLEKESAATNIAGEETANIRQKQADLKNDQENDLKDLIDKISETIDKKEDSAIQTENKNGKLDEKKESKIKETEESKQSFWSNISEKLKNNKSAEPQKINDIKKGDELITKSVEHIKIASEKDKEDSYNSSGILTKKELPEIEKRPEEKKEIEGRTYDDDNYQPPENRLIFGKQKKYSSVSKRIKLKEKKDEIEDMKNANEIKEKQKIISESEKYKRLKNRVIRKYNIKLFSLPWKKIIPMAIILIALSGAIYYILVKELVVTPPEPPVAIIGTEIEKFSKIKSVIEFTKKDIAKMSFKELAIDEKFKMNSEIKELRIVIKDNDKIVSLKEALKSVKIETGNFPNDFWNTTTDSYNLFVLKTNANDFRFAIAMESNDIASLLKTMGDWEQETVDIKKMFNIFEPFFTDSETREGFDQHFESANYGYVYIRYINLPDKDTSFDYFANDNTLIIATSKENTNRIIDILNNQNYYNYDDGYYDYDDDYDRY